MIRIFKVLVLVCVCFFATGCSLFVKKHVSVHGNISHLGKSELFISYYKGKDILAYDTVNTSESGKFEFKLESFEETTPVTIYFNDNDCWTTLFARSGDNISITGDINLVDLLEIKGGDVNNDLDCFKKQIRPLYQDRQEILNGKYKEGGEDTEVRLAEINLALKRKAKEFILDNPSSEASVVLIQDFFYQDYDPITKELVDILTGEAKNSHLTSRIREGMLNW
jgi:hypothetical protein